MIQYLRVSVSLRSYVVAVRLPPGGFLLFRNCIKTSA
nr:MAG TPA: hypothetical protein [Caudoviricetes sp.]